MVLAVIFALVGSVVWLMIGHKKGIGDHMIVVVSVVVVFICMVLGFGISVGVGAALPKEYVLDRQMELVAMQEKNGIQARFFLGTSTIGSKAYYLFYQEEENEVRFNMTPAENTVVYEENKSGGLIKKYDRRFTAGWHNFFGVILRGEKYEIFIPKGSTIHEFNLDLK